MDLMNELNYKLKLLDNSIKSVRNTGTEYARAYKEYRIALAKRLLELKKEGYAITLAGDIARGDPEIAQLKFKELSTEAIYKANLESINALKLEIKIIQGQIDKEWGSSLSD